MPPKSNLHAPLLRENTTAVTLRQAHCVVKAVDKTTTNSRHGNSRPRNATNPPPKTQRSIDDDDDEYDDEEAEQQRGEGRVRFQTPPPPSSTGGLNRSLGFGLGGGRADFQLAAVSGVRCQMEQQQDIEGRQSETARTRHRPTMMAA